MRIINKPTPAAAIAAPTRAKTETPVKGSFPPGEPGPGGAAGGGFGVVFGVDGDVAGGLLGVDGAVVGRSGGVVGGVGGVVGDSVVGFA